MTAAICLSPTLGDGTEKLHVHAALIRAEIKAWVSLCWVYGRCGPKPGPNDTVVKKEKQGISRWSRPLNFLMPSCTDDHPII